MTTSDQLTLLGTGSCELGVGRGANSALIRFQDLNVAFDFGHGTAAQISALGITQNQLRHIVISHFHPDHSSDLIPYLQAACWSRIDSRAADLNIYGPPGIASLMERMLRLYEPNNLHRADRFTIKVHEITAPFIEIEGHKFEFADLPGHSNHGLAFTVNGKRYALTGDSSFHDQEVDFVKSAEIAVIDYGHLTDPEVVELASRAQPKLLVLSHIYSEPPLASLRTQAKQQGFTGEIILAEERMTFKFPSGQS